MLRSLLAAALLASTLPTAVAAAALSISQQDLQERIDTLLSPWDQADTPGLAVLVQSEGADLYQRCVGMADLEQGVAITPRTCFDLASVSKHLTAFGVLLLADEGRLSLDDSVRRYLPELPMCTEPVQVRHLLHQSSGLWEFWTILNKYSGFHPRDYIRLRDVLTLLAAQSALNFAPGSRYAYTNTNYSLLSLVVERASNVPFGTWMQEHVFAPLGMAHSLIQTDCTELIPHRAAAYLGNGERDRLARPSNVEVPGSAHAFTNLEDLSRWLANFRDRRLGGERVFESLTTPGLLNDGTQTHYAAGLFVNTRRGAKTISHSGQTGGYKTMLIYCPEEELGVVVLANSRSIHASRLAYEILDLCRGVVQDEPPEADEAEPATEPEPFTPDVRILDTYSGGYRLEDGGQLIGVYRDREWLVAALRGLGGDYFTARSETEFSDYAGSAGVTFERDRTGNVVGLSLTRGGTSQRAHRVDIPFDAVDSLVAAGGHYVCPALGSLCELAPADGHLALKHRRYDAIELFCVDQDEFFCEWGFLTFTRDGSGEVTGFSLTDELFAWQGLPFFRIDR